MNIKAKLHHIAITISKEENLDFYKTLGFKETLRNPRPEKHDTIVFMNGLGTTLEIFIDSLHMQRPVEEPMGLRHICFEVEDIKALETELDQNNINHRPINPKYNNLFIKDNDGQEIEFKQEN